MSESGDIVRFENVSIEAKGRRGVTRILSDVSFSVAPGDAFGLVGESGCGKSTIALALMRYLAQQMRVSGGRILFEGKDLALATKRDLKELRGRRAAMVYQDPTQSLNPVMKIGDQLAEVALIHGERSRRKALARAAQMLSEVRIADPEAVLKRYPHQLSGGQQQRVVIAMALMATPRLLVMDEPTTGLDVTIEAAILELVADLRRRFGTAILFISHNLGTVARVCDSIGVLYAGRLVETGPIRDVFKAPSHPYTRGLLAAIPRLDRAGHTRLATIEGNLTAKDRETIGCAFASRCPYVSHEMCEVRPVTLAPVPGEAARGRAHEAACARVGEVAALERARTAHAEEALGAAGDGGEPVLVAEGLSKRYIVGGLLARRKISIDALKSASITARLKRTLAIVGESGSGKSTLAKVLVGIAPATTGKAVLAGTEIAGLDIAHRSAKLLSAIQMVFQNPDGTLNPSHSVAYALARPLRRLSGLSRREARREAERLIERVRMGPEFLQRRPHQLSGGQRQRIAIARALAGKPKLMIADEPVSALDVSVQAAIVNLLGDLLKGDQMALVLISHDLALVRHMADDIAVMYAGRIVEYGPADEVISPPQHPYTAALLAAAPRPDPDAPPPAVLLSGTMPSPMKPIQGCAFAGRCPMVIKGLCETTPPPERKFGKHVILCHLEQPGVVTAPAPPA